MNRYRHSPLDDYDRMSDYYQDLEDVHPKEKSSSKAATNDEPSKNKLTDSIASKSQKYNQEVV